MTSKVSRRIFISQMLLALAACTTEKTILNKRLVIGIVSYGQGQQTVERLSNLSKYLSEKLKTIIEIEPAYNERMAIERIKRNSWSLVFANPGLAAIGISQYQYWAMFPLELGSSSRSIIVVNKDSSLNKLQDLQGKKVALGQQGSATGYYLPLFNMYGLTLASAQFASTPKLSLELLSKGEVDAAALSLQEFNSHKSKLDSSDFRILFRDSHIVPSGSVLCSPRVERKSADVIRDYMKKAPLSIIREAKYIPNVSPPDYKHMIGVVKRVGLIAKNINSQPVRIFN